MDFKVIGEVHSHEAGVLSKLSRKISEISGHYQDIANFYRLKKIRLTRNQHKVLSFLYSVYFLDDKKESSRTWITTREISESVNVNIRGDWARKNCHKLSKMNLIMRNSENKWYIAKYGIFYMHDEVHEEQWPEQTLYNASVGSLELELKRMIEEFIRNEIKEINKKFKEPEKDKRK